MPLQIGLGKKSFFAKGTWKRLLFQMCESVIIVMVSVHEAFSTYLTYEVKSLLMAFNMQLIIVCRAELFTAVFLLTGDNEFFLKEISFDSQQSAHIPKFRTSCNGEFI